MRDFNGASFSNIQNSVEYIIFNPVISILRIVLFTLPHIFLKDENSMSILTLSDKETFNSHRFSEWDKVLVTYESVYLGLCPFFFLRAIGWPSSSTMKSSGSSKIKDK